MERAVMDVEEGLATSYEVCKRHREVKYLTFWLKSFCADGIDDLASQNTAVSTLHSNFIVTMPDPLASNLVVSSLIRLLSMKILVRLFVALHLPM
jgi:hypothetical protein